ncbi:MAG: hypothetical protein ACEQSA_00600 [Weeksellaceae bacterium]
MSYTDISHLVDDHQKKQQQADQQSVSVGKEGEPMRVEQAQKPDTQEIQYDETEPDIDSETQKYVEVQKEDIQLDPKLKKAGLQAIDSSKLTGFQSVQLPISDEKVMEGKKQPITSSWRWLSEMCIYLLRQAHLGLKEVHGHVVRVIRR